MKLDFSEWKDSLGLRDWWKKVKAMFEQIATEYNSKTSATDTAIANEVAARKTADDQVIDELSYKKDFGGRKGIDGVAAFVNNLNTSIDHSYYRYATIDGDTLTLFTNHNLNDEGTPRSLLLPTAQLQVDLNAETEARESGDEVLQNQLDEIDKVIGDVLKIDYSVQVANSMALVCYCTVNGDINGVAIDTYSNDFAIADTTQKAYLYTYGYENGILKFYFEPSVSGRVPYYGQDTPIWVKEFPLSAFTTYTGTDKAIVNGTDNITQRINDEIAERTQADADLDGKIAAETTARTQADNEFEKKITAINEFTVLECKDIPGYYWSDMGGVNLEVGDYFALTYTYTNDETDNNTITKIYLNDEWYMELSRPLPHNCTAICKLNKIGTTGVDGSDGQIDVIQIFDYSIDELNDELVEINQKIDAETAARIKGDKANLITNTATGNTITVTDAAEYPLQDLNVYGNSTQNGTPTPTAPINIVSVGDSGSVDVTVCGKNLRGRLLSPAKSNIVINADNKITSSGNTYDARAFTFNNSNFKFNTIIGESYTVSIVDLSIADDDKTEHNVVQMVCLDNKDKTLFQTYSLASDTSFTFTAKSTVAGIELKMESNMSMYLQIEKGTVKTDYEEPKYQTLTIPLTESLYGLSTPTGKLICDEICVQDGKLGVLRRCKHIALNGDTSREQWLLQSINSRDIANYQLISVDNTKINLAYPRIAMCNRYPYSIDTIANATDDGMYPSGFEIYFRSKTYMTLNDFLADIATNPLDVVCLPTKTTFTPFNDAVQVQYQELSPYLGIANISNSDSANMNISYVADTKTYIDNKFDELKNAIMALS